MLAGAILSLASLIILQVSLSTVGEAAMVLSAVLLIASIVGARPPQALPHTFQSPSLAHWAQRLDDLMKYDVSPKTRSAIVEVLDLLWRSPQDQDSFIPAQNTLFDSLLNQLEESIKRGQFEEAEEILEKSINCLRERNHLIAQEIQVGYRTISDIQRLPGPSNALSDSRKTH